MHTSLKCAKSKVSWRAYAFSTSGVIGHATWSSLSQDMWPTFQTWGRSDKNLGRSCEWTVLRTYRHTDRQTYTQVIWYMSNAMHCIGQTTRKSSSLRNNTCHYWSHLFHRCCNAIKSLSVVGYTPWFKKLCQLNHGYNFVNSWSICNFFTAAKSDKVRTQSLLLPTTPYVCCCITLGNLKPFARTHFWRHYRHTNWPVEKASPGMCSCKWWTFWTLFVNKLI